MFRTANNKVPDLGSGEDLEKRPKTLQCARARPGYILLREFEHLSNQPFRIKSRTNRIKSRTNIRIKDFIGVCLLSDDKRMTPPRATAAVASASASEESVHSDFVVEPEHEPHSIRDRLAVIRQNYMLVLAVAILCTVPSDYKVNQTVPLYSAAATVRFADMRSNLTSGVGSQASSPMSWATDNVKSQMELLTTRATAEKAVDVGKLQLEPAANGGSIEWVENLDATALPGTETLRLSFGDATFTGRLGSWTLTAPYGETITLGPVRFAVMRRPPAEAASYQVLDRETAIAKALGVQTKRRPETDIVDLSFESPDPVFAQRALNATVLGFQGLNTHTSQEAARARRVFLDAQLGKSDSLLEVQRADLSSFRTAKQAFSSRDRISAEQAALATIRSRREELQADRQVYVSLLARAQADVAAGDMDFMRAIVGTPGISANPAVMQVYAEFSRLRIARDSLTAGPFPAAASNPDLQRINALMASAASRVISAVKSQIDAVDARVAALQGMSDRGTNDISTLPRTEAEEARLIEQAQGSQRMAEQLREEQQRARISEIAEVGQVQIIDLARLPDTPVNGGQSRTILYAGLFGLIVGAGLTVLLDSFDTSLRRISDVERLLGIPMLGAIPELSGAKPRTRRLRLPSIKLSDVQFNGRRSWKKPAKKFTELHYVNPSAPAFESFRALRTSLIFSNAVQSLRSVLVTSAAAGDGKSTTSTNLAAAFAQQGMRVLIVDCDLRRGRLHSAFTVPRSPGLTEVILGSATVSEAVNSTAVPNLSLLCAGQQPPNPTELLGSEPVRDILMSLTQDYDLVIIDTPPVLAAADAAVLSAIVDGVVMVVRVGVTDRRAAKRSLDRLLVVGARVLGVVMNDPQELLGVSEDHYYYQYQYSPKKIA